jgi:hypothetical protein
VKVAGEEFRDGGWPRVAFRNGVHCVPAAGMVGVHSLVHQLLASSPPELQTKKV